MSPDVRDRDKPVRPRSRTPDERDAEVKRRKETIKREVSTECFRRDSVETGTAALGGGAGLNGCRVRWGQHGTDGTVPLWLLGERGSEK